MRIKDEQPCVCGHQGRAHQHYRSGSDCSQCIPGDCGYFRKSVNWRTTAYTLLWSHLARKSAPSLSAPRLGSARRSFGTLPEGATSIHDHRSMEAVARRLALNSPASTPLPLTSPFKGRHLLHRRYKNFVSLYDRSARSADWSREREL